MTILLVPCCFPSLFVWLLNSCFKKTMNQIKLFIYSSTHFQRQWALLDFNYHWLAQQKVLKKLRELFCFPLINMKELDRGEREKEKERSLCVSLLISNSLCAYYQHWFLILKSTRELSFNYINSLSITNSTCRNSKCSIILI